MISRALSSFLVFSLLANGLVFSASAEDLVLESEATAQTQVDVQLGPDVNLFTEVLNQDIFLEESDLLDSEVMVQAVAVEEVNPEAVEEFAEATQSGSLPDSFYLAVRWGYFSEDAGQRPDLGKTDWDGVVEFRGLLALPIKALRFESDQEDSIDFENSTIRATYFNSDIYDATDGIFFKVKTDLDVLSEIVFDTDGLGGSVSTQELLEAGVAVFDYGEYQAMMTVWTPEEWVRGEAEEADVDTSVAQDVEKGSWYEPFVHFSLQEGFAGGYKNEAGQPTGEIGPADNLTRFQLLKIHYELASRLGLGVGATGCDSETVLMTDNTAWMGDHWARGYIQCVEDSGLNLTLLDEIIVENLAVGDSNALRWEVVATAFEMLDMDDFELGAFSFTDLENSGLKTQFQAMIEQAVDLGIIRGYPDHSFQPYREVNRAEMFKIVSMFYQVLSLN